MILKKRRVAPDFARVCACVRASCVMMMALVAMMVMMVMMALVALESQKLNEIETKLKRNCQKSLTYTQKFSKI